MRTVSRSKCRRETCPSAIRIRAVYPKQASSIRFWPLGYLFLLTFIFLIVVVLMNLLNGLTVSDMAVIRGKAEIVTYIIRVETISCFEAVLLGDPFNFLSSWPAIKILKDVPSLAFCKALYGNAFILGISHKITGATEILLFYLGCQRRNWSPPQIKMTSFVPVWPRKQLARRLLILLRQEPRNDSKSNFGHRCKVEMILMALKK